METTQRETTTMALATPTPQVPPEVLEAVFIGGDLSQLTAAQRADYYGAVCRSLGLNPLTKPFEYLHLNGMEYPQIVSTDLDDLTCKI